jgi:integrase
MTMLVSDFIDQRYWPKVKDTLSAKWQRRTEDLLGMIKDGIGVFPIDAVPVEEVEGLLNKLRAQYKSPVTPNKVLARGKHLFNTAVRWNAAPCNPFKDFKRKKEPHRKFRPLSATENDVLFARATPKLQWYIIFGRYTGARQSSLAKLEERDIRLWQEGDETCGEITFRDTKNGEDYTVPLHPELLPWVRKALTGDPNRRLLPQYKETHTISSLFRRLKKRVGVSGFRFHDYRHSVGTALAAEGHNTKVIMEALGHKDERMSLHYTHVAKETLRDALRKAKL